MRERRLRSLSIFVLTVCLLGSCRTLFANSCVALFSHTASANRVVYLRQIHWVETVTGKPELINYIASSQYNIALEIIASPSRAVFAEGVPYNHLASGAWTLETLPPRARRKYERVLRYFPSGLPIRYELLTPRQKETLARLGAAQVLFALGNISKLFGTDLTTLEDVRRIEKRSEEAYLKWGNEDLAFEKDPILRALIMGRREHDAKQVLDLYFRQNPGKDVFLVFGGEHQFQKYWSGRPWAEPGVGFEALRRRLLRAVESLE